MNKEVKEIKNEFLHIICTQCNYQDEVKYSLTYKQMKILLDYITSLEQAIKNTYETSQDLLSELQQKIDKAIEFIDNYDVFKEFSFPLMKRDVEQEIKCSIDYEFRTTFRNKLKNILNSKGE